MFSALKTCSKKIKIKIKNIGNRNPTATIKSIPTCLKKGFQVFEPGRFQPRKHAAKNKIKIKIIGNRNPTATIKSILICYPKNGFQVFELDCSVFTPQLKTMLF